MGRISETNNVNTEHNTQISDTGYHKKGNEMENKQRDSIDTKQRNEITRNQRQKQVKTAIERKGSDGALYIPFWVLFSCFMLMMVGNPGSQSTLYSK